MGAELRARACGLAAIAALVVASAGCVQGLDVLDGSDEAYYRLYDYTIDRPRVMGISVTPHIFTGGDTVTFEALAAAPGLYVDTPVEWWGCGVTLDVPFIYYGADCLDSSIAEKLGEGSSLTMTMPDYDVSGCYETSCYGYLPLIGIVHGEPESGMDDGYGVTFLIPDYLDEYGSVPGSGLDHAQITFYTGEEEDGDVNAKAGEAVPLTVKVRVSDLDLQYSWYVSAGTLDQLGITHADEVVAGERGRPNLVYGRNTLRIPADFRGDLYVYVVIDPADFYAPGLERFATAVVRVDG